MGTAGVSVNLEIRYGYQGGAHAWHEGWWANPRRQRVTCRGLADLIKPAKPMQSEPQCLEQEPRTGPWAGKGLRCGAGGEVKARNQDTGRASDVPTAGPTGRELDPLTLIPRRPETSMAVSAWGRTGPLRVGVDTVLFSCPLCKTAPAQSVQLLSSLWK